MIQVLPEKDINKLTELYKEKGIEFNENSMAVIARDGQEVLGLCLFEIDKDTETVFHLEPADDIMMADGILRSALHVGVTKNVTNARLGENLDKTVFQRLGFLEEDGKTLKINKLFESCCSGCGHK